MSRLLVAIIVIYAAIAIYSVFDAALRDRDLIKIMPKWAWVLVIIFIPLIGLLLWYLFGRTSFPQSRPRGTAPDDDADYLNRIDREMREERERQQRRRERGEDPGV